MHEVRMISRDSLGELAAALHRAGVSQISVNIALGILADIGQLELTDDLQNALKDWLKGQRQSPGARSGINFIPSDHKGVCHDLLITVCAGERNFDLNTMKTIALCINCHSTMRAVIIVSDYWNEEDFNKWRKPSFKALQEQFPITFFIVTLHVGRWEVSPII